MKASATSRRFTLLDLDVLVESTCGEILDRLDVCYREARGHPTETQLKATVCRNGSGFDVDVDGRTRVVAPDAPAALRSLNHELLHGVMLRRRQFLYVHAGVVAVGDSAIVLPGLSQAGKSTLVLALLAAGARYLSDELLVYDPRKHRVLPYPRAPKVRDTCVGYFAAGAAEYVGEGEGRFLRLETLGPRAVATSAVPRLVAAPRWDPSGSDQPKPISSGEVLLRLVSSTLNFGMRDESLDDLAVLAGQVKGYDLAWCDPHAAAIALLGCLDEKPR